MNIIKFEKNNNNNNHKNLKNKIYKLEREKILKKKFTP